MVPATRRADCFLHIDCRIHAVNVLLIQLFPQQLDPFLTAVNMK